MRLTHLLAAAALLVAGPVAASAADADWAPVATALGKAGAEMPGGVYRVGMPRTDLQVTLEGVQIKPTLALGSWLAFHGAGTDGMVMGDLVLTETEVGPVMKKLAESGIEITALHSRDCSSCTSGPTTMPPSWPGVSGRRWTT
jgi:hypothetical protein